VGKCTHGLLSVHPLFCIPVPSDGEAGLRFAESVFGSLWLAITSPPSLHIWVGSWPDACVPFTAGGGRVVFQGGGSPSSPRLAPEVPELCPGGTCHFPLTDRGTWATGSGQTANAKWDVICSQHQPDSLWGGCQASRGAGPVGLTAEKHPKGTGLPLWDPQRGTCEERWCSCTHLLLGPRLVLGEVSGCLEIHIKP